MSQTTPATTPSEPTGLDAAANPQTNAMSATRRQILAMATVTCGATVAASLFQPARADLVAKLGKFLYLDPTVLNFAFEMEELERDLFSSVARSQGYGMLTGTQRNLISLFAEQDSQHFEILNAARDTFGFKNAGPSETLNQASSRVPRNFTYPRLSTGDDVLKTVLDVKETVLFAYHGAVGVVRNKELLKTAAAIAGVEGRHTAVLRMSMGLVPVTAPFEGAIDAQKVGYKLSKYGFKGGAPR